jgi:hypothetical protein
MTTKEKKIKMAKAAMLHGDDALAQKLIDELDNDGSLTLRMKDAHRLINELDAKRSHQKTRQIHIR